MFNCTVLKRNKNHKFNLSVFSLHLLLLLLFFSFCEENIRIIFFLLLTLNGLIVGIRWNGRLWRKILILMENISHIREWLWKTTHGGTWLFYFLLIRQLMGLCILLSTMRISFLLLYGFHVRIRARYGCANWIIYLLTCILSNEKSWRSRSKY